MVNTYLQAPVISHHLPTLTNPKGSLVDTQLYASLCVCVCVCVCVSEREREREREVPVIETYGQGTYFNKSTLACYQ